MKIILYKINGKTDDEKVSIPFPYLSLIKIATW